MKNDIENYFLSKEENESIFKEVIQERLFSEKKPSVNPSAIILGGQPGAGKSSIMKESIGELSQKGDFVILDADDFREYHPENKRFMLDNDKTASLYTGHDAGQWLGKSIAYAKTIPCHMILETTLRQPPIIANTMKELKEAGYHLHLKTLAVHEKFSWLGVVLRYEEQKHQKGFGRMTSPETHQSAYSRMAETLKIIEEGKLVDKLSLYRRDGTILYDNTLRQGKWEKPTQSVLILEQERNRPWTLTEISGFHKQVSVLLKFLEAPERNPSHEDIQQALELKNFSISLWTMEKALNRFNLDYQQKAEDISTHIHTIEKLFANSPENRDKAIKDFVSRFSIHKDITAHLKENNQRLFSKVQEYSKGTREKNISAYDYTKE